MHEIARLMGRIVKGCVRQVSLAQVSCILMYIYVAPPTYGSVLSIKGCNETVLYNETSVQEDLPGRMGKALRGLSTLTSVDTKLYSTWDAAVDRYTVHVYTNPWNFHSAYGLRLATLYVLRSI